MRKTRKGTGDTITITEERLEVVVGCEEDWPKALRALRRILPNVPPRPSAARARGWRLSAHGRRLLPGWLAVMRRLAEAPDGIAPEEVSATLGCATMNGIGRATVPIKRLLAERASLAWSDAAGKVRTREGVIWHAGPKIAQAMRVVEDECAGEHGARAPAGAGPPREGPG